MKYIFSSIESVLRDNIKDKEITFVFNSEVASSSWALRCVEDYDTFGVRAVDMERFIAWDEFCKRCTLSDTGKRRAIDASKRRLFASSLLAQNAVSPFLKTVVPKEFASDALYLSNTIAKRLPALNMWKKLEEKRRESGGKVRLIESERNDYETIYEKYKAWLEKNNLFETSWEDFHVASGKYILFYPSIIEDWIQYKDCVMPSNDITVVELPKGFEKNKITSHLYPTAPMEIRKAVLHIRKLLENGEDPSNVALVVPSLLSLYPYVERELYLYGIPFVKRAAFPLSSKGIGRMFRAIYDCYTQDFSLQSVRTLLQSSSVPWKEYNANGTVVDWTTELVRIGSTMRCLCRYTDKGKKIDPWETVLSNARLEREKSLYRTLKDAVASFAKAKSFSEMRQVWFSKWRGGLLDDSVFCKDSTKYDSEADAILSSCIDVIYKEEQYENTLKDVNIVNHYDFFLDEIDNIRYTMQEENIGVNVFDYKVSALASYPYNVVINASQDAVTVNYKTLDFLSDAYRKELLQEDMGGIGGIEEIIDVSKEYLTLYSMCKNFEVSCSSNAFSGYSTMHSYLYVERKDKVPCIRDELDEGDFVMQERKCFLQGKAAKVISNRQVKEINNWAKKAIRDEGEKKLIATSALKKEVLKAVKAKKDELFSNVIFVTATGMNNFYPCARKWLLKCALGLQDEDTFDSNLMPDYSAGSILHKILEIFCKGYMERKEALPTVNESETFGEKENDVRHRVEEAAKDAIKYVYEEGTSLSSMPLVSRAFSIQSGGYVKRVIDLLHRVCKEDKRSSKGEVTRCFLGGKYVDEVETKKIRYCEGESYALYGRIDCIFRTEEGGSIIVDYKSGTIPTAKDSKVDEDGNIGDFQMPLYVSLVPSDIEEAVFLNVKGRKDSTDSEVISPKYTKEAYNGTMIRLFDYVKHFAERVEAFNFDIKDINPISLPLSVFTDCIKCPYNAICRKTYTRSLYG